MKIVNKGWGYERWIVNNEKYCGKLLYFVKDKRCSWHYHKIKEETFYIQSGRILLHAGYDDDINLSEELILTVGDSYHIKPGLRHQMLALETTEMFEFSTQHFEEDSYRIIKGDQ
jgi:mannose-6-phosphate isomerase-like protein (cupin superfamily)